MTTSIATIQWSEPKQINTKGGERNIRQTFLYPDHPAWSAWRFDKEAVKSAHFSLGKQYQGSGWELTHWESSPGQFTADASILEQIIARSQDAEVEAKQAQKIDYVAEHYEELTTAAASKLFDWQRPSCQRIVAALKTGNAIDASQTGAGKTYVALAACAELGLTPYIIAPLAVLESWRRASAFMGVEIGGVTNYDKARAGSSDFIFRNKEAKIKNGELAFSFVPQAAGQKALIIYDEAQKCKGGTKTLQGRVMSDIALRGEKILILSATAAKDPTEMESSGIVLGLHEGGKAFTAWAKAHGCKSGSYGLGFTTNAKAAADIMGRIHRKLFPARGSRIRSADVPGYPDNAVSAALINSQEIVSAYQDLEHDLSLLDDRIGSGDVDKQSAAAMGLAAMMKARRSSEKGKLDYFIDETKELLADGQQVAIFLNFREHLAIIRDALKLRSEPVWGTAWLGKRQEIDHETGYVKMVDINGPSQTTTQRQQIIDDFQAGRSKVILVSLQAGGAGISLHDVNGIAPRQSLISPSYSAVDLVQAIGRIWRAGSHSKATQRIVYAAGTIEEEIAGSITAKIANIETLNDGDLRADSLNKFTHFNPASLV